MDYIMQNKIKSDHLVSFQGQSEGTKPSPHDLGCPTFYRATIAAFNRAHRVVYNRARKETTKIANM